MLNLWDCGGQDAFYESYFERDRETIFRSVELLIYVFDIESESPEKDFDHFCGVLEAIEENSPDARIFVLVHKMDLVAEEDREAILLDRKRLIADSCTSCGVVNFQIYGTSIWDETLYKAWSEIVTNLIPNIRLLETHLNNFCRMCDADEVVLFERATFLVISHAEYDSTANGDVTGLANRASNINNSVNNAALLTDGGGGAASSSPPTDAVDVAPSNNSNNINMASSPMSHEDDSKSGGGGGGDGAPESTSAVKGGEKAVVVSGTNRSGRPGAIEETPHHVGRTPHFDAHRFEKVCVFLAYLCTRDPLCFSLLFFFLSHFLLQLYQISNIVKQFKLSCGKAQSEFQGMEVRNSRFSAFIDAFTANTYIMVIVSNPHVHTAATLLNIQNARNHFERFIPRV